MANDDNNKVIIVLMLYTVVVVSGDDDEVIFPSDKTRQTVINRSRLHLYHLQTYILWENGLDTIHS